MKRIKQLPYPLRQTAKYIAAAVPYSIRLGRPFWQTYRFLQDSERWDAERLRAYQLEQLRGLLAHAREHVPHYRRLFSQLGFAPEDVTSIEDLSRLPTLAKDEFRARQPEMLSDNADVRDRFRNHTSGTSGKALQFYQHPEERQREWAFVCHQWARAGYRPTDARIELRGAPFRPDVQYEPRRKVLRLSPVITTPEQARRYAEAIAESRIGFLHGYPTAIAAFAQKVSRHGIPWRARLRAVLFTSEVVYDWQRDAVAAAFGCTAFAHYGMAEHVITAAQCEGSLLYHPVPQYGITEVDPATGELIGTGFLNRATLFIRYRTGDFVDTRRLARDPACPACGRAYAPLFDSVLGRQADFITLPDGTVVAPAILTFPFKDLQSVRKAQIAQLAEDLVQVTLAPWDEAVREDEIAFLSRTVGELLGGCMQVRVVTADDIPDAASGKYQWVVSKLATQPPR